MQIRRGLLFGGLFFITVGAIELLVRNGTIDPARLDQAWTLWPLILIGLGIALLLGRSRVAIVGTVIASLAVGVIVGGAIATGGDWIGGFADCGGGARSDDLTTSEAGGFNGPSSVDLSIRCGKLSVSTDPGIGWSFGASYRGPAPELEATVDSLQIRVPEGGGLRYQDWTVLAGAQTLARLKVQANGATAAMTLAGARLEGLDLQANAGDVRVDGTNATIQGLDVQVNAARARITLDGGSSGEMQVNAGAIDLCVPQDASLHLVVKSQITFATNLADSGLTQNGNLWTRTGSADGGSIDLAIQGNAATFTLEPSGGCG
jgi:Domain of unknown function (DUF5668)